jgi:hypothetical protein
MTENEKVEMPFEIKTLAPGETWFDPIEIRLFRNSTKRSLALGFGHTMRKVEIINIIDPTNVPVSAKVPLDTQALEGEIIEEEI